MHLFPRSRPYPRIYSIFAMEVQLFLRINLAARYELRKKHIHLLINALPTGSLRLNHSDILSPFLKFFPRYFLTLDSNPIPEMQSLRKFVDFGTTLFLFILSSVFFGIFDTMQLDSRRESGQKRRTDLYKKKDKTKSTMRRADPLPLDPLLCSGP